MGKEKEMNIFYIDYENVQSVGLMGVDKLTVNDKVVIFYSSHADSMKIEIVRQLQSSGATIEFIEADSGTLNALDFQLVAFLFININSQDEISIVSRDKGFDVAISMAEKNGFVNIHRIQTIEQFFEPTKERSFEEMLDELSPHRPGIVQPDFTLTSEVDNCREIEKIIEENCGDEICRKYSELIITGLKKSSNKNQLYQFFRTNLGDGKGGDLYRSIRKRYEELKVLTI